MSGKTEKHDEDLLRCLNQLCICQFRNDGHKLDEWLEMRKKFDVKSIIK